MASLPRARCRDSAPARVRQLALHFAASIAGGDLAAAVVELLALAQPELQLRLTPLGDVDLQRDQGQPLRFCAAQELIDLVAMEQELAVALRLVVEAVAALPRRD